MNIVTNVVNVVKYLWGSQETQDNGQQSALVKKVEAAAQGARQTQGNAPASNDHVIDMSKLMPAASAAAVAAAVEKVYIIDMSKPAAAAPSASATAAAQADSKYGSAQPQPVAAPAEASAKVTAAQPVQSVLPSTTPFEHVLNICMTLVHYDPSNYLLQQFLAYGIKNDLFTSDDLIRVLNKFDDHKRNNFIDYKCSDLELVRNISNDLFSWVGRFNMLKCPSEKCPNLRSAEESFETLFKEKENPFIQIFSQKEGFFKDFLVAYGFKVGVLPSFFPMNGQGQSLSLMGKNAKAFDSKLIWELSKHTPLLEDLTICVSDEEGLDAIGKGWQNLRSLRLICPKPDLSYLRPLKKLESLRVYVGDSKNLYFLNKGIHNNFYLNNEKEIDFFEKFKKEFEERGVKFTVYYI